MNVEFFPCSGGFADGFRRAGVTFDLAIEKEADHCDSYERNHGHRPLQVDVHDFAQLVRAGWRPQQPIDLLVADPPCTPWSRAGKREGLDDERDCLAVTAELIALLRPRAYLIGNVPGLQDATSWHVVQDVIGGLARHGYCVADYASLDAADYGVPQHRVRPFWFGHLDGPCIRWPAPTHGAPTEQLAIGGAALLPWVTCRDALGHLPIEQLGRPVRMALRPNLNAKANDGKKQGSDVTRCSAPDAPAKTVVAGEARKGGQILIPHGHRTSAADAPAPTITTSGGRAGSRATTLLLGHAKHPVNTPDAPSRTVTAKGDGRGAQGACVMRLPDPLRPPAEPDEPHRALTTQAGKTALLVWPWDRPSTTVCTRDTIPPPGHHPESGSILSQPNAVVLSERAAAILQGFPEGWTFAGKTKKARWSQIGQAMPPPLAEAVARAVVAQMRSAREVAA